MLPYRALTADELRRFFAAIPRDTMRGARDYALFVTYFFTARRRSEIVALNYGDIEQAVLIEADGKRRLGWVYHYRSKGHKRQDTTAELPQIAVDAIFRYLEISGKLATIQPTDPIFTTTPDYIGQHGYDPHRPLAPHTVWKAAKRYAKAAGIPEKKISVHALRHTAARERYAAGSDIRSVQQLLGHTSLQTTDTYLRQIMSPVDTGYKLIEKKFEDL